MKCMVFVRSIFSVFLLFISFETIASDKLKKLEQLFYEKEFLKCYNKSFRYKANSKLSTSPIPYCLLAFSAMHLSKKELIKVKLNKPLKSAMRWLKLGLKKDRNNIVRLNYRAELLNINEKVRNFSDSLMTTKRKGYARNYVKFNAEIFKDSSAAYFTFFPKEITKVLSCSETVKTENKLLKTKRDSVIEFALKYLGTPYKWGGESINGVDCSGFTAQVINCFGGRIPHSCKKQSKLGNKVKKYKKGDLAFMGYLSKSGPKPSHVAIVVSNYPEPLKVIHSTTSKGVRLDVIPKSKYWAPKLLFIVDVLND